METLTFGSDADALLKLDPRTKLFIFFSCMMMTVNNFHILPVVIYETILCAVLALCGRPWTALKGYAVLLVSVFVRAEIGRQGGGAQAPLTVMYALTTLVLFCLPVYLSFQLIVRTTRISQFLSAFSAMRLPARVIIPLAVMLRFIPTVQEEWAGIRKAMAFRGITIDPADVALHPMRTVEYILIPLLFSCISVMEELAAAALARGMDADQKRSSYETVKMRAVDYLTLALFAFLMIYVMLTRYGYFV